MAYETATDSNGNPIQGINPKGLSLARVAISSVNSSTYVAFQTLTGLVRVYAIAKDVYLKWATSDQDYCTSENFDEVIPAGQIMDFSVPQLTASSRYTGIHLVGRESGASAVVIEK